MRNSEVLRKTNETDISLTLELDSSAPSSIKSGVDFFDHMLSAVAKHGKMKIDLLCSGDTNVDDHHSVEDIGICLGTAFKKALGDKKGITRFGTASVPMDEALSSVSIDISGRGYYRYNGVKLNGYIKTYDEELTNEFFQSFAINAEISLHINLLYGDNRHHIHESIYKSFAVALYTAYSINDKNIGTIPSTKGVL